MAIWIYFITVALHYFELTYQQLRPYRKFPNYSFLIGSFRTLFSHMYRLLFNFIYSYTYPVPNNIPSPLPQQFYQATDDITRLVISIMFGFDRYFYELNHDLNHDYNQLFLGVYTDRKVHCKYGKDGRFLMVI